MIVLRKDEDEWWTVKHSDGRTGSIPVPYIEIVSYPILLSAHMSTPLCSCDLTTAHVISLIFRY